jgi:hypothetical protein
LGRPSEGDQREDDKRQLPVVEDSISSDNHQEAETARAERQAFLAGDYKILRTVSDLPGGIQRLYTVKGESRIAMADPGKRFESTDVVTDPTLPSRRLIFAGVVQDRAFVHYEQGGIGSLLLSSSV